ncbi:ACT domain-containing protein [Caulobacter soli]|uniref:ACT domain-containing protein n=1 Tax=Caulobacter soli TaxID=2708539 RepID=UPI0013ECA0E0|nr:ACT domain-containing protein [Caulobacter soli]
MTGETDLSALIASMDPVLDDEVYVFATLPLGAPTPAGLMPVMTFREREGLTLIVTQAQAQAAGLEAVFSCRMITLNIHSSLEAVGFLAALLPALAAEGMGVNPVSGFFHDHLFVPTDRAEDALRVLKRLTGRDGHF